MSDETLFSAKNKWFSASVGLTAMFAAGAAVLGLVVFPTMQNDTKF